MGEIRGEINGVGEKILELGMLIGINRKRGEENPV